MAIEPRTVEAAIRSGNEFLQIKAFPPTGSAVRQIEEDEQEPANHTRQVADPMETLLKAITKLTEEVNILKTRTEREKPRSYTPTGKVRCYGCNQEGHIRRDCRAKPWTTTPHHHSGNGTGPQH